MISTGHEPTYTWSEVQKQIELAVKHDRQQRTWVGLTDDEILDAIKQSEKVATGYAGWVGEQRLIWGRAIEAKLKEKNT